MKSPTLLLAMCWLPIHVLAAQPSLEILDGYARQAGAGFAGFSAERGQRFFNATHPSEDAVTACASCHSPDPTAQGKHQRTGKRIKPLAPSANPERLSNAYKVEKWFGRNCKDVLQRECTVVEKGDVVTWLLSIK